MTILLVEDDDGVAGFVASGLTAEGYAVKRVSNGQDGYDLGRLGDFEAILLDIMLPGMNGREICRRLREDGIRTPIVMLTALDSTEDLVRGLRFGADEYITKPFAFEVLLARLEAVLRRARGEAPAPHASILKVGDLVFDRDALSVERGGVEIELTSTEYAFLELLMTQAGKIVTKPRVLETVWGTDKDPLTNVVEVYVGRLRTKLSPNGEPDLIKTVRGRGYRMSVPKTSV
ncbi:MAG: response regulator transcription factor [Dinoroseobacter sp.]|nr:response regulator transcription factor [Dinoroseobacter sp.]